ncbi:MAG: AarF/UbiB family protein [Pseudomonadota bacterium]
MLRSIEIVLVCFWAVIRMWWFSRAARLGFYGGRDRAPLILSKTLEGLGGIFVKLGQFMAMRPDIVPQAYAQEADKLLDRAQFFPFATVRETIEADFGKPLEALYESFEEEPLAAASFAQVHRAKLHGGKTVAVKIQRPNLARKVNGDLRLMRFLAWLVESTGLARRLRIKELVEEFGFWTSEELSFKKEAAFATAMRESDVDIEDEYIPEIFWEYTSERVLTLEFLSGVWVSQIKRDLREGGPKNPPQRCETHHPHQIAHMLLENMLRQVFERGTFHADPHAGNLVILDDGRVGYVDFGITGQIDKKFRDTQLQVLLALSVGDLDKYYREVSTFLQPIPAGANREAIRSEIISGARNWMNAGYNRKASLRERGSSGLLLTILETARRHNLSVSNVAVRYFRSVIAIETLILVLHEKFPYRRELKRILRSIQIRQLMRANSPDAVVARSWTQLTALNASTEIAYQFVKQLDDQTQDVVNAVDRFQQLFAGFARFVSNGLLVAALVYILDGFFAFLPIDPGLRGAFWAPVALVVMGFAGRFWARKLYLSSFGVS